MRAVLCVVLCLIALPVQATIYDYNSETNIWAAAGVNAMLKTGWITEAEADATWAELCQYRWMTEAWSGWLSVRGYDPTPYVHNGGPFGIENTFAMIQTYLDSGYGVTAILEYWELGIGGPTITPYGYGPDALQFVYAGDMDSTLYDFLCVPAIHSQLATPNVIQVGGNYWLNAVAALAPPAKSTSVPEPSSLLVVLTLLPLLAGRKLRR